MEKIEEQVAIKLEQHENDSELFYKYLKLNARVLKERMTVLATSKRFEEAELTCSNWKAFLESYPAITSEWKVITTDYLRALYFKPLDQQ